MDLDWDLEDEQRKRISEANYRSPKRDWSSIDEYDYDSFNYDGFNH